MEELKLAVIGAGALGSRHLQALALLERPARIQVVDHSSVALENAANLFTQVQAAKVEVEYLKRISDLSQELDAVVIATNSDVRRKVLETLLEQKTVKNLILEKVLFQNPVDYNYVGSLLAEKGVKAWVNCPRRIWSFYRLLKDKFLSQQNVDYNVSGSLWGLGCNAIHFIDNLAFITGETGFQFAPESNLEPVASKRPGFVDFTGTLRGRSYTGNTIRLTSYPSGDSPVLISILSDSIRCIIRENEGKAWISEAKAGWQWDEHSFATPYQSQLTNIAVEDIVAKGDCQLTSYDESVKLHLPMLEALMVPLRTQVGKEVDLCPIT